MLSAQPSEKSMTTEFSDGMSPQSKTTGARSCEVKVSVVWQGPSHGMVPRSPQLPASTLGRRSRPPRQKRHMPGSVNAIASEHKSTSTTRPESCGRNGIHPSLADMSLAEESVCDGAPLVHVDSVRTGCVAGRQCIVIELDGADAAADAHVARLIRILACVGLQIHRGARLARAHARDRCGEYRRLGLSGVTVK